MEEENNNLLEEKNQEILIYEQQVRDYEAKLKIERKKSDQRGIDGKSYLQTHERYTDLSKGENV